MTVQSDPVTTAHLLTMTRAEARTAFCREKGPLLPKKSNGATMKTPQYIGEGSYGTTLKTPHKNNEQSRGTTMKDHITTTKNLHTS